MSMDEDSLIDSPEEASFPAKYAKQERSQVVPRAPLAMVETAFLASAASLIWLINYYFPLGASTADVFPHTDRLSLSQVGKPSLLDGGNRFGVIAVRPDGANP
jgi:hypothetical protein